MGDNDTMGTILDTLLVLILACLLTFLAVWMIAPNLIETLTTGDSDDQADQIEPDISVAEINDLLNATGAGLSVIERKMRYIDPDDRRNLSVLSDDLNEIKLGLHTLDGAIAGLDDKSGITGSIEPMSRQVEAMQEQIEKENDRHYADVLAYGLKGIASGVVLCILVVALPYVQYRRGKLYGLIGHGGEGEYARDRFIRFLYVMMALGFVILVIGLLSVALRIVLI